MGSATQQYCLRWNNHRSNLLTVFDELLRIEAFTDVSLACDGGFSVKCHRMVLAACSSYFQALFTELPCRHPVVVLKDVKFEEMKAIMDYMYRGEVNVAQDELAGLLKVAETLKIKGLVEENRPRSSSPQQETAVGQSSRSMEDSRVSMAVDEDHRLPLPIKQLSVAHSSSSVSPPHSSGMPAPPFEKNPYNLYGKSPVMERSAASGGGRMTLPMWAMTGLPLPHHPAPVPPPSHPHATVATSVGMLNSCYEATNADMSPLQRKKRHSMYMSRDTPILRTVLGQGQPDSSQPISLVCQPDSHERIHSNGFTSDIDKSIKCERSFEEVRSPYTDISQTEDDNNTPVKKMMMSPAFPGDHPRVSAPTSSATVSSGIATYVPTQKPEWKRYKQYTRNDIMSAIDAVRGGMSALQAARMYGVPSRTLYDKVKKMGITTSRPFNKRGMNVSSPSPHGGGGGVGGGVGGGGGGGGGHGGGIGGSPGASSNIIDPILFQQALDGFKREIGDHDAMAAVAMAAAAAASRSTTSSEGSSHGENGHCPSSTPSPSKDDDHQDEVEDLSVSRKTRMPTPPPQPPPQPPQAQSVIVPPIKKDREKTPTPPIPIQLPIPIPIQIPIPIPPVPPSTQQPLTAGGNDCNVK